MKNRQKNKSTANVIPEHEQPEKRLHPKQGQKFGFSSYVSFPFIDFPFLFPFLFWAVRLDDMHGEKNLLGHVHYIWFAGTNQHREFLGILSEKPRTSWNLIFTKNIFPSWSNRRLAGTLLEPCSNPFGPMKSGICWPSRKHPGSSWCTHMDTSGNYESVPSA